MSKYKDLVAEEKKGPKISQDQLGGWENLAQAYRELDPDVTYAAFRSRVLSGKSVIEAGTMPRSPRGRPRKIV
jgi:hypothetical protein